MGDPVRVEFGGLGGVSAESCSKAPVLTCRRMAPQKPDAAAVARGAAPDPGDKAKRPA